MKYSGTVALVGRPNVGKSSLLNVLIGQKIAPTSYKPQTTQRQVRGILTKGDKQIIFVDTPGMLKAGAESKLHSFMLKEAKRAFEHVDVVVWVEDASARGALGSIDLSLLKQAAEQGTVLILALNKVDKVVDKKSLLPVIKDWSQKLAWTAIVPTSATKLSGLDELIEEIGRRLPEREFEFDEDALTDSPERLLVAELIREKAMLELGEELPYQVAVQIESFDESRRQDTHKPLVEISAQLIVARSTQKSMVIGAQGKKIKAIGIRARKELEILLGCQVMLNLFVRVEPDWTQSPGALRKLGYV